MTILPGLRHLRIVALLLVGLAMVVVMRPQSNDSTPAAITKIVGNASRSPLVIHPNRNVEVGVSKSGMVVRNRGARVTLSLVDRALGPWVRHASGSSRTTSFGAEVVRYGLPATEEYAIVRHHLDGRALDWTLSRGTRAVDNGGSIDLYDGLDRPLNLHVSPVHILDLAGRDITPRGTRWSVAEVRGRSVLRLHLDERSLPSAYIVDPAVTFSSIAVAQANAATSTAVTIPAGSAAGDLLVVVLGINTTAVSNFSLSGGTSTACTTGGWSTIDTSTTNTDVTQVIWKAVVGSGDAGKTCQATWTGTGETVMYLVDYTTGTYYTAQPIDYAGPAGTTATTSYTSNNLSTYFDSEFLALAAIEDANKTPGTPSPGTWTQRSAGTGQTYINSSSAVKIGAAYFDSATRSTAGSGTVTGTAQLASHTIAAVIGIRQADATAPTVSLTAPAASAKIKNGQALTATLTDEVGGSGAQKVEYYYCVGNVTCNSGTGSPTLIGSSSTASTYSVTWNGQPVDGTYTVFAKGFDRANNSTDSSSVVVTIDNTAPSFTSAALSGASPAADLYLGSITGLGTGTATGNLYYNNGTAGGSFKLNVGLADAGSGLASYSFPALTGTTLGWTYTAQGSTATSGSSASVTNANTFTYALTSTGPATETATVTDAAGNTGSLALTYTKDTTGPTVSINSPAASSWNKNGQSLGVTVSDGGAGVGSVAYYYCAGAQPVCNSTTGSPTLIGTASSSPWSVTWSSMPANGNYKIFARAIDNVSNATDSAAVSVNIDNAAPAAAVTTPASGQKYRAATLLSSIAGTASDSGGSSLSTVTVSIQSANGDYWNNTTHTWGASVTQNTPSGTSSWTLTLSSFTADGDGTYTITATSTDGAGNTGTGSQTFVYDGTSPTASVTTPSSGQTYTPATLSSLTTIAGSAADSGGSSLSTVTVKIQSANGNYWNNTTHTWGASVTQNTPSGTSSWSLALSSFSSDGVGTYTITATSTDGAGNTGTGTQTFVYSGAPASVGFSPGSSTYGAVTAWTESFTASSMGSLAAASTVTVTFPAAFSSRIPASPTVTFGGSFSGCGSTTGSTAGTVVTITLPAGCSLAASATGTVAIAGITNPVPASYAASGFLVHTSSDLADGSPAAAITISQKALTVAGVTASNKVYDASTTATLNTSSAALVGIVGSDTVTLTTSGASGSFASKTVGSNKTVTVSGLTLGGADAADYTLTQPTTTANITAKTLTVTGVTANDKTYDRTTAATLNTGSAALSGVVSGDTVTLSTAGATGSFATATVGTGKTVTVSSLTIGAADAGNYSLTQPTTTASITAKALTVTGVTAGNKTYDRTTTAAIDTSGAALSGVVSGDTVTLSTAGATGSFATAGVGTGKTVTVAGLTIGGADAGEYTLTQPTTTANITAKTLTVTGITASNKTYDRTMSATLNTGGAALSGVIGGDTVTLSTAGATGSFATATVGTGKTVTVGGLTIAGADAGNYSLTQPTTTANITAKTLTVSGVTASNKTYDGTTAATLGGTAALNGVVAGDTVTVDASGATGTFASKHAGTGITVTVAGITIGGADAGNYSLTQPTATANITAKNLTISGAVGNNRVYDATTTATADFSGASLAGVVSGDSVSIDASSASFSFASKTVGTAKAITASGVALTGTDAADYTVSQPTGLTANVTAKALTVTGVGANDKTYNGTTADTLSTGSAALSGVVSGDTVTLSTAGATGTFATSTVGTNKAVTISGLTIGGADAGNYSLTQPTGQTANITAKGLTVSGITASDKTYDRTTGATLDTSGAALNGVVSGDTVTLSTASATGSFGTAAAGAGKTVTIAGLTIGGADAGNYSLSQPTTTASITAKALTVSGITASNKTYDRTTSATIDPSGATLNGVVSGDTVTLGTGSATGTFTTPAVGIGKTVTIAGLTIGGADAGNYSLTQPTATANITANTLTVTGISASNKVYDRTTGAAIDTSGATLNGVVSGDTVTLGTGSATGSFATAAVGAGKTVTIAGLTIGGADAGNYSLIQPTTTANVTAKSLTVTGITAANKAYDRTTTATIDTSGATLTGVVSGDTVTLDTSSATGSFATAAVGTSKTVTISGLTIGGAGASNYTLAATTTSADVSAKALTVTGITASNKVYDRTTAATIDTSGATLNGVVSGDTVTLGTGGATGSFATKTVGTSKTVTIAGLTIGGADAANYSLAQPAATADITVRGLTVSGVTASNKTYDGTTWATLGGTASLNGVIAGDTVLVDTTAATGTFASKHVGSGISVTAAGITISGADAANYSLTQPTTTASISAKNLTVNSATGNNRVYDGTTTATVDVSGASLTGVVGGDSVSIDASSASFSFADKNVGAAKAITASGVALAGANASDYTVSQPTGLTATVTAKTLTIGGVAANSKVYDGGTAASLSGTASLQGVVSGDAVTLGGTPSATFADAAVGASKAVTVSGYSLSGSDAGNYTLSQPAGLTASITAKGVTVAGITASNKVYDATTAATLGTSGATLNGVVSGDTVTLSTGSASGSFATKTVGTNKTVTIAGLTIGGADAGNYSLTQPTTTANITAQLLTIAGVTASNKTYDGTTSATLGGTASLNGVVSGDTVGLDGSGATATFADKDAGTGKTVTTSGFALTGADAGNYTVSQPTTTAAITKKALTVSGAVANDKPYDGTTAATVDFSGASLVGVVGGETVTLVTSGSSASFAQAAAGSGIAVAVSGVTLGGADAGNYTVAQPSGLTASITGRPLSITGVTATNKVYDATTADTLDTSGATLNGVVGGDDVTLVTSGATGTFAGKDIGVGKPVTVNGFTLTGADAPKYMLSQPTGLTANITAKPLTVAGVTAGDKVYDGGTAASLNTGSASLVGVVSGDGVTLGGGPSGSFASKTVGANKTITVAGFTLGGADAGDYTLTQPTTTASITAKSLTVSGVTAADKVYDAGTGATLNVGGATLNGVVGGDTVLLDTTAATGSFASKSVGANKTVGVAGITISGTDAANYALAQPTTAASITPRNLTVGGAHAADKTYDDSTTASVDFSGATLTGVQGSDSVSIDASSASAAFGNKDAGANKPVAVGGVALAGTDAANYTVSQPTGLTASITPASLTIAGVTAADKVYDASATATLNTGGGSLVGVLGGDDVHITGTPTGSFATKTVGANKPVATSGFTLGGTDASNYSLAAQPSTTASITAKTLTVSGVGATDKVYDGTTTTTLSTGGASLVGVVSGDTVTLGGSPVGSFADKTVGANETVTVSGYTLGGTDAGNYALTQPTSTASITAKALTVTGVTADDKVYDGTTAATLHTGGAALAGVVGGDAVTLGGGATGSFATKTAGAGKTVTIAGFTLGGADAGNYTLTQPATSASILAASLTVTGVTANDKVYDGSTSASLDVGGASLAGVVSGDTVTLGGTPSGAFGSKTVGTGKTVTVSGYALGGGDAGNYVLTQPTTTASITAKALTITGVTANDKVYDGTPAAGLDTSSAALAGVVNGDVVGLGGSPTGTFVNRHVGANKPVTASGFALTGADATNYSVGQPTGLSASITHRALTVTAQTDTKVYDASTSSSVAPQITSGSVAAGDTASFTQAFATAAVGTNKTITASGSVADGNGGADYTVSFVDGTGTITPAAPAKLAFTQAPASASGGIAFATQPRVAVEDAYGNVITTDNATHVTLALGANPSGATLSCPTSTATVTVSGGVATFAGCRLDRQGTGYTLATTNNAGLADATSGSFDVVVGTADAATSTVSGPATVVADGSTPGTVTVTLKDTGGNPVPGKTVALAQDGGKHATIAPASAVTDAGGHATFAVRDQTQEPVTFTATDVDDAVTVTQTATVSFEDHTSPSATIGAPADGVSAAGNLTLGATGVTDGETGIQGVTFQYCHGTCQTIAGTNAGGGTWTATLDTTALTTGQSYTWSATATDKAGNSATTASRTFSVDNSVPLLGFAAPTLDTPAIEYYDGSAATPTLWLNSSGTGSFELDATAADAQSGIAKVHFPALLGTAAHDVTGSSPYQSQTYSFTNPASDVTGNNVVATNGVTAGDGANTTSTSFDVKVDGAGPTATMSAGLDGKVVASGVLVGATSADAGSGVKQVAFVYCDRTANPVCNPTLPLGSTLTPTLGTYSVTWTTSGLVDGRQYAVAAVATDNVGNSTTSAAVTVTVDNSAPSVVFQAPTTSGDVYYDGTRLFVKATGTGSYTLHAHATDAQSSIASVMFGADAGTAAGGGDYDSPSHPVDGTGATLTVTATNGVQLPAGLTASDQLQRVPDASTPTTGVQFPVDNGGYDTNSWQTGSQACSGSQPEGLCGTVSDAGSGVKNVKLTLQDLGGGKYFDGAGFQSGVTTLTVVPGGNTWSYPLDHSKLGTGTYELKVYATDNVGNAETTQTIDFQFGTDLTPPDTQLTLTNATHAALTLVGTHASPNAGNDYDLYYSTAGTGGFTLHAVSTDVSGIDHVTFPAVFGSGAQTRSNGGAANPWTVDSPAYSFGSGDTTPPGQAAVTSVDTAIPHGNSGNDTITFLVDDAAPTGGSITVGPVDGSGYATTTSLTVAHQGYTDAVTGSGLASSVLTVASSGLSDGTCAPFGSDAPVADGGFTATNGTCYRFTLTGTDKVGNVATTTQTLKVDATAPSAPAVAFSGLSAGNTYDAGAGTFWYRPSAGGAFTVTATSTDAESGIRGYAYSSLLGGTQSGGQLGVAFGSGGIGSGTYTVKATNRASLDSAATSFSVDADSNAPVGGALEVNGTDAAIAATSSYLTTGSSVAIDARTDYTDADSGLAASALTLETGTLSHDTCSAWGAPATIAGTAAQSVSNGHCYRFTLTGIDHVGNAASISTVVKVDTTAPTTTGVVFSGLSAGNTYDDGHGTLWYRPSTGAFIATLTGAADPETDIAATTFSPLAGFASTSQSGAELHVTFDGSSTGGGGYSAVATNNAGVDSAPAAFTVTADTAAPTGGLLSIAPYSSSLTLSIGEQDFGDAGSGISSNTLTRSVPRAPSAGSCPGSGYSGATPVAVSGGAASDTVPVDGTCYEYTLTGTDRVGNVATYEAIVLVDTTPATGGSVEAPDGATSLTKISVDWSAGTDPESGIATVDVERAEAALNGSTCDPLSGFTTIVTNAGTSPVVDAAVSAGHCYQYRIVVTNRAGVQATFTSASVTKLTNASPIALAGNPSGAYLSGSTLYLGPAATSFALQLTSVGQNGVTSATWSAGGGTVTTAPFTSGSYAGTGTIDVTRQPTGTIDSLTVVADGTAPSGSVDYVDGVNPSHSVAITTSASDAGGSGLADGRVLRSETALTGSACDSTGWTAFAPVSLSGGSDTTVADDHCYRYEYTATDNVGNSATFTSTHVVQIPDITPPTFSSAATDASGAHLTITLSEPLDAGSTPNPSRFVVAYNGAAQAAPTSVQIVGSTVVLGLAGPPNNSQSVTVRYASDDSLRDDAAPSPNAAASFGPVAVTNGTTDTVAPTPSSAAVDGSTLTLHFDEPLAGNAPAAAAFTVSVHGAPRTVTAVTLDGATMTLTLAPAVSANDTVVVRYAVPALDALHDASGNTVAAFTSAVTNNTAVVVVPPPTTTSAATPVPSAPFLVAATPADGSTITAVGSFSLTADEPVHWTNMTLTRPDGSVTTLADASGASATYDAATTAPGLYVVHGTIAAAGGSADVLTHFTIWTAPATGTASSPPVQKNAGGSIDSALSGDGTVVAAWTASTFGGEPVVIQVAPKAPASLSLPPATIAVDVTAFMRDSHLPVTQLGDVLDVQFPHAPAGSHPQQSQDAKAWHDIPALPTLQLPAGQGDGWFRDSDGTVHVLTRHLTYFALLVPQADTKLALRVMTPRRLWLAGRTFMAVRILVTAPARVTGSFVAADGTVIPGQVLRTPTRRAGATMLRIPLRVKKPGIYRLQVRAEGAGQTVRRTARIRFLARRPASPIWQSAWPLRVAMIRGLSVHAATLGAALGHRYLVHVVDDADLYAAVDPRDPHAATAVVVDLETVPPASLVSLHNLLPELRIIGLTRDPARAAAARAQGIRVLMVRHLAEPSVTHVITRVIAGR